MAIVKTIDVALRADVEKFDSGLKRGMKSLEQFQRSADKIAKQMGDAAASFQHGGLTAGEFGAKIQSLDAELAKLNADQTATTAGFAGMAGATSRAAQVMRGLETASERYSREVRELNTLQKIGALTTDQHAQALQRLKASYTSTTPALRQVTSGMSTLDKVSMLPGVGAYAGRLQMLAAAGLKVGAVAGPLIAVGAAMRSAFRIIDTAGDKAIELGIDPNEFLAISFAAERAGVAAEQIEMSLQRVTIAGADAAAGNKQLTATFAKLGITTQQLKTATPYETLRLVADGLEGIASPAERARLAVDLFGKRGIQMLQVLNGGADALDEARQKLDELGATISGRGIGAVDALQGSWAEFKATVSGASLALFNDFAPALVAALAPINNALAGLSKLAMKIREVAGGGRLVGEAVAGAASGPAFVNQRLQFSSESARAAAADFMSNEGKYVQLDPVSDDTKERVDGFFAGMDAKLKSLEEKYSTTRFALESMFRGPLTETQQAFIEASLQQEAFTQQIADINKLFDANLITIQKRNDLLKAVDMAMSRDAIERETKQRDLAMQAFKKRSDWVVGSLRTQLQQAMSGLEATARLGGPAAIERGTQAAFSQFRENQKGVDVANKQLELQKKMEAHLAELKRRGIVLAEAKI